MTKQKVKALRRLRYDGKSYEVGEVFSAFGQHATALLAAKRVELYTPPKKAAVKPSTPATGAKVGEASSPRYNRRDMEATELKK